MSEATFYSQVPNSAPQSRGRDILIHKYNKTLVQQVVKNRSMYHNGGRSQGNRPNKKINLSNAGVAGKMSLGGRVQGQHSQDGAEFHLGFGDRLNLLKPRDLFQNRLHLEGRWGKVTELECVALP